MSNKSEGVRLSGRDVLRAEEERDYGRSASRARSGNKEPDTAPQTGGVRSKERQSAKKRRRFTVLWFVKKSIVPLLWILGLFAGMYVGYIYLGKGNPSEVFEVSTWKHMFDLIFSDS
ncbi:DNA-directed RNA polymerase subunit beta [Paenibacillus beijingensis]|uniref:DNA-directed RNA polymerase subunit beta n=1 Tax=Paenibacillus beijingensis TaxID=1126833 RepID=A0A0D5NGY5_9BACL|nr:DNA-directed RNA polymerase subunit beta [Paenibacillus beijingensis]AJY74546.1 hypothetical protein VN24_08130 [Paenibacillus beijingensis]